MGPSRPAPAHLLQTTGPRPPVFVQLPASALPGAIAAFPLRRMFKGAWKLLSTPLLSHRPAKLQRKGSAVYGGSSVKRANKTDDRNFFVFVLFPYYGHDTQKAFFATPWYQMSSNFNEDMTMKPPSKVKGQLTAASGVTRFKSRAHRFQTLKP